MVDPYCVGGFTPEFTVFNEQGVVLCTISNEGDARVIAARLNARHAGCSCGAAPTQFRVGFHHGKDCPLQAEPDENHPSHRYYDSDFEVTNRDRPYLDRRVIDCYGDGHGEFSMKNAVAAWHKHAKYGGDRVDDGIAKDCVLRILALYGVPLQAKLKPARPDTRVIRDALEASSAARRGVRGAKNLNALATWDEKAPGWMLELLDYVDFKE